MKNETREFFNDAVQAGKRFARKVGNAACDLADEASIRIKIADLEREISRKYRHLGRLASGLMDAGELAMDEEMQSVYNEIVELKQSVAVLKEEL